MPGFLTYYVNNKLLDAVFGGQAVSPPSTYYVGLSLIPSQRSGSISEVSGGNYMRVAIANNLTNFPASVNGTKSNANAIVFQAPTANWGVVYALFFADALTGGNVWLVSDLAAPRTINSGAAAPQIAAGAAVLQDS